MAKQTIALGTAPTGVGGDTPRSAFTKVQANFDELYAADLISYKKNNILGSVSQAGGVPTGGVIERGSNANGDYVKYADGTMICWFKWRVIRTMATATGPLFFGGAQEVPRNFPVAFLSPPAISIQGALEVGEGWFVPATTLINSTTQWPAGYVFTQLSRGIMQLCVDYLAIGRWF